MSTITVFWLPTYPCNLSIYFDATAAVDDGRINCTKLSLNYPAAIISSCGHKNTKTHEANYQ